MSTPSTKSIVIVAPHVDDEVIGCWSYLSSGQVAAVVYLYEWESDTRQLEAEACSQRFGFTSFFGSIPAEYLEGKTLLVPAVTDSHPDHKKANKKWRTHPDVLFYRVDLSHSPTKKLVTDFGAKKEALDALFPSQKALWETNASYYLFEDIQPADFKAVSNTETVCILSEGVNVEVQSTGVCQVYAVDTLKDLIDHLSGSYFKITRQDGTYYESWD
jgi:hypothetical protein